MSLINKPGIEDLFKYEPFAIWFLLDKDLLVFRFNLRFDLKIVGFLEKLLS